MAKIDKSKSTQLAEPMIEMCPGKSWAWGAKFRDEPHPAFHRHPPCEVCGADMGCARCSGPTQELLCYRGKHWGSRAAFIEHGALRGQQDALKASVRDIIDNMGVTGKTP